MQLTFFAILQLEKKNEEVNYLGKRKHGKVEFLLMPQHSKAGYVEPANNVQKKKTVRGIVCLKQRKQGCIVQSIAVEKHSILLL